MSKPNQKIVVGYPHCSLITQGNLIEDKALTVFEEFSICRHYDEEKER
ncbi:MAG: hypothetical protein LBL16_05335 [Endomicrobium sp.]|jgi:hypothetical protein|nr:hypothetical protein [Endomicrobium sp.]